MSYDVWISTQDQLPNHDPGINDDDLWQLLGYVETGGNKISRAAGQNGGSGGTDYIMVKTTRPWVVEMRARHPRLERGVAQDAKDKFWLAVAIPVSGGNMYRITTKKASFTTIARNPPGVHPGLIDRNYVAFPVKIVGGQQPAFRTSGP